MKGLWDMVQAIVLVTIIGAVFVAIPLIGLFLAIAAAIALVYGFIKEESKYPK